MNRDENRAIDRRTALGAGCSALLATLAGCPFGQSRGRARVDVRNTHRQLVEVELVVTGDDSDVEGVVFRNTTEIGANETLDLDNEIDGTIIYTYDYTVEVNVSGGPSRSYDWNEIHDSLYVTIMEGDISFQHTHWDVG